MDKIVRNKMLALRAGLLSAYNDSCDYPAPVTGREREVFLHSLLTKILPTHFRVGSGVITDRKAVTTGQIDLVVELPLSLSFPVVGENRLYFADTVGAAIEVKSNLSTQWDEAEQKLKEVNSVCPLELKDDGSIRLWDEYQIPFFIIAYKGPKRLSTIEKKIRPRSIYPPAGVYVVESNLFIGYQNGTLEATTEAGAMLAFIISLYTVLSKRQHRPLDLLAYA